MVCPECSEEAMMCQDCWEEAYLRAEVRAVSQAEVYNELIESRSVTFHAKHALKKKEVPDQEVQAKPKVRPQKKRGTKK